MRRIALVQDHFVRMRSMEKMAEAFLKILPMAEVHTTLAAPDQLSPRLQHARIHTTWMRHLPKPESLFRHYFMLYPFAVESMNLKGCDLILSNGGGYAKGVRKDADAIHICYSRGPMPWVWRQEEYLARTQFGGVARALLPALTSRLKRWDLRAAQQPDYFIAASRAAARRIKEVYQRESLIIPPPIDVARFTPGDTQEEMYLMLTHLESHRRIELAIEAVNRLRKRLVIIGDGPHRESLQQLAGPTVKFFGRQPSSVVERYLQRCSAFIFTGREDFAKAPLEANASGRPVIVPSDSGVAEFIQDGRTGLSFDPTLPDSLAEAMLAAESGDWNPRQIHAHAAQFDQKVFNERIMIFLRQVTPWMWKPSTTNDELKLKAA